MDMVTAYLYTKLEEENYVDILEGVELAGGVEIRGRLEGGYFIV